MILIYGLLDRQARRIGSYGGRVLVLRRDQPIPVLSGVEAVVLALKFIGHSEQCRAVALYGHSRVLPVRGGQSAIRRAIEKLLAPVR